MSPADDAQTVWTLIVGLAFGGVLLAVAAHYSMVWWFPGVDDEDDLDDGGEW